MAGALEGIRIVDLTTVILGPWATQMLGDMGADVIKIETPTGDTTRNLGPRRSEGMASLFLATNRNKRSIVLDLKQQQGRDALARIVDTADVFLHNFRPKLAARFGLEYERFAKSNPALIFCATYGFRREGPLADKPAYDDIIQAACGMTDLQRVTSDQPRYVPTILADKTTAFHVVSAILAALFARERGGSGQSIEVPMFESMVDFVMVEHLFGAAFEPPIASTGYTRLLNTARKPYATSDGYLAVLPYTDENWRALFEIAGRRELIADPRFADLSSRVRHSQEIYDILAQIVASRSTAEWQQDLDAAGVPVMAVNSIDMLLDDEQLKASGFWHQVDHPSEGRLRMTDPPVRFSGTPSSVRSLAPLLGQHSAEVLAEAGYSANEIAELFASGISACPAGDPR